MIRHQTHIQIQNEVLVSDSNMTNKLLLVYLLFFQSKSGAKLTEQSHVRTTLQRLYNQL